MKETKTYAYQEKIGAEWALGNWAQAQALIAPTKSLDEPIPGTQEEDGGLTRGDLLPDTERPFDEVVAGADSFAGLISRFDERTRQMMVMRFGLQYTAEEIGQEFGLKANSVRAKLSKAVGELRGEMTAVHNY